MLIRDPLKMVAMAAIKSPGVTEIEAARYAGNQTLPEEVIRYIATKREWTKLYGVKVLAVPQPEDPDRRGDAAAAVPAREGSDQRSASRKGIPSAVVAQARKLMMQRKRRPDKK